MPHENLRHWTHKTMKLCWTKREKAALPGTLMYYQRFTNVFKSVLAGHLVKKLAKRAVLWRHCREGVSTEQAARFRN